jgi:hypothetical protein
MRPVLRISPSFCNRHIQKSIELRLKPVISRSSVEVRAYLVKASRILAFTVMWILRFGERIQYLQDEFREQASNEHSEGELEDDQMYTAWSDPPADSGLSIVIVRPASV